MVLDPRAIRILHLLMNNWSWKRDTNGTHDALLHMMNALKFKPCPSDQN